MSRENIVEALTKCYPSVNPDIEYFNAADSLLGEFSLYRIIQSEQRTMTNVRSQWDVTYWVPDDNGRKVIRYLRDSNKSTQCFPKIVS
jgi:hypothetical protein